MHSKDDIPFHYYSETCNNVNIEDNQPVLSIDTSFPFLMTQFDIMNNDTAQAHFPHRHDYFEILFVEDSSGEHIIDYDSYTIKPPVFYFLSKGQIHFWKLNKPLTGKAMLFPREFLIPPATAFNHEGDLAIFNGLSKAPCVYIDDENLPVIRDLLSYIKEEFLQKSEGSLSMLRAYVHILLVRLFRIYASGQKENILDSSNAMVRNFRQLVSENYLTVHSVQEYADLIGISATHLRDTVKEVTGYSPGQLIRQEIIFEAKRKLANTEFTTAEIGYSLNFEDTSYFSRFFKRETGKSPSNYREEIRKKYQITL